MGAGYMQSISVPHFRFPVFSELQGPMQDGYGIREGWIQQSPCVYPASPVVLQRADHRSLLISPAKRAHVYLHPITRRNQNCACGGRREGPRLANESLDADTARLRRCAAQSLRGFSPRGWAHVRRSRSFGCAQDFACGLRRPQTAQVVKDRSTSRLLIRPLLRAHVFFAPLTLD